MDEANVDMCGVQLIVRPDTRELLSEAETPTANRRACRKLVRVSPVPRDGCVCGKGAGKRY